MEIDRQAMFRALALATGAPACVLIGLLSDGRLGGWRVPFGWLLVALALGGGVLLDRLGPSSSLRLSRRRLARVSLLLVAAALVAAGVGVQQPAESIRSGQLLAAAAMVASAGLVLGSWLLCTQRPGARDRSLMLIALVLVLGLGVRVATVVAFPRPVAHGDTIDFVRAAHSLLEAGRLDMDLIRAPGYPVFYAASSWLLGELGVRLLQSLLGTLLAGLIGVGAARYSGRSVGVIVFTLVFLSPRVIHYEQQGIPELPFVLMLVVSALCLLRGLEPERGELPWFALAGAAGGLAISLRPNAIAPLAVAVLLVLYWLRGASGPPPPPGSRWLRVPRRALLAAALVAGCAAPLPVAWSLRNWREHGELRLHSLTGPCLLATSARQLDLDSPTHAEAKGILRGRVLRMRSDPRVAGNVDWFLWQREQGGGAYRDLPGNELEREALARSLAREAILAHPLSFLWDALRRGRPLFVPAFRPHREHEFVLAEGYHVNRWAYVWSQPHGAALRPRVDGLSSSLEERLSPTLRAGAWLVVRRAGYVFNATLYPLLMLAPLLALVLALRGRHKRGVLLPALMGWALLGPIPFLHNPKPRYAFPATPLFVLAIACAVRRPED